MTLLLIILFVVLIISMLGIAYFGSYKKASKIGPRAAKVYEKSHTHGSFEMNTRHPLSYLLIGISPILIGMGVLMMLFPEDLMSQGASFSRTSFYTIIVLIGGFTALSYGIFLFRKKSFRITPLEIRYSVGFKEKFKIGWNAISKIRFFLTPDPRVILNFPGVPHIRVVSIDIEFSNTRVTLVSYTDLRPENLYAVARKLREEALKYRVPVEDGVGVDRLF